jgi:hypothetical protein
LGGRKCLHLNKENFKKKKRATVQIPNPQDSLCLPRAIVVVRLHAQKPEVPDPDFAKNGNELDRGITILSTRNDKPLP